MTATLVNLRRVRKAKARAEASERAAENRALHGKTKAERALAAATEALERRFLDAHQRETSAPANTVNDQQEVAPALRPPGGSTIVKHSLTVAGHRTSISLEQVFWDGLSQLAAERGLSVAALVVEIDAARGSANLSSAIRVFVCNFARLKSRSIAPGG